MFRFHIKNKPNFDSLKKQIKKLDRPIDEKTANLAGSAIVKGIKEKVATGYSPILGRGRFPAYLATQTKNKRGYPYNAPKKYNKKDSPVNLKLSGDFLKSLTFDIVDSIRGVDVVVSYKGELSELKEQGHREGQNGQPKRPTLPNRVERLASNIYNQVISIYKKRIRAILDSIS